MSVRRLLRTHGSVVGRSVRDFAGWGRERMVYEWPDLEETCWRVNVAACS